MLPLRTNAPLRSAHNQVRARTPFFASDRRMRSAWRLRARGRRLDAPSCAPAPSLFKLVAWGKRRATLAHTRKRLPLVWFRTMRSLSPRYLDAREAEDTLKKEQPHSVATGSGGEGARAGEAGAPHTQDWQRVRGGAVRSSETKPGAGTRAGCCEPSWRLQPALAPCPACLPACLPAGPLPADPFICCGP